MRNNREQPRRLKLISLEPGLSRCDVPNNASVVTGKIMAREHLCKVSLFSIKESQVAGKEAKPIIPVNMESFMDISEAILKRGGRIRFTASGSSMGPFIKHGDVIDVDPVGKDAIKLGDIIFFARSDSERAGIVHRVIKIKKRKDNVYVLTKGDALVKPDGLTSSNQVLGRVISLERDGREVYLLSLKMRSLGLFLAVGYPFSYRAVGLSMRIKRLLKRLF